MKSDSIGKRIRHREDMFLRRLFGILARMAKIDGKRMRQKAHLRASRARRPVASSALPYSIPQKTDGRLSASLPPNLKKSGPRRKIASRYMSCFGI